MAVVEIAKIQVRRGQENQTGVPRLDPGEFGWAQDTQNLYIGKSRTEGANSDDNARILTDKDLSGIFSQVVGAVNAASTGTYRYGLVNNIPYSQLHSTTSTTFATKLDNWVSLTDFAPNGVWPPIGGNDITTILHDAIGTYANPYGVVVNSTPGWTPKAIKIPAGNWTISGTTDLPPNTKLIGEGANLTVITASTSTVLRTVDSIGRPFSSMSGIPDGTHPKNIHIEGMTIISTSTGAILLSLDNVSNADIVNVNFGNPAVSTSTHVNGIEIRGSVVGDPSIFLALSSNIKINDCNFNGLNSGVYQNTGTTNRYYIQNSEFTNMNHGVEMWSPNNEPGPVNGVIDNNIFERIAQEAIYIGTTTNTTTNSYVVSSNNSFRNVGNNLTNDASTQITPVITFNNRSNSSVNDYFSRLAKVNTTTNYPIVSGPATIQSSINYSTSIGSDVSVGYTVTNIVLTGREQLVTIDYTMVDQNNTVFTRTGQLTLNVTPANTNAGEAVFASVSDYFNYAEAVTNSSNFVIFSTDYASHIDSNYVSLVCYNQLGASGTGLVVPPISITNILTTSGYATYNFNPQPTIPFATGSYITVSGVSIAGYNGSFGPVTSSTNMSVTVLNATTGTSTGGTITGVFSTSTNFNIEYKLNILQ